MNIDPLLLILIVAAVLVAVSVGVWSANRKRSSQNLREKFGPEYDYTMEKAGDRRRAEETLKEREKRVTQLDIRALNETEKERYHTDWIKVQANFVDEPSKAVEDANRLITEVMIARGFPVADFEQRAADLSVMVPDFVSNYRSAYSIVQKNQRNETTTEDLRQAMVYFRSLFEELLGTPKGTEVESKEKEPV